MSQENVELVREGFRRWNEGDYDYFVEVSQPDVEIHSRFASLGGEMYVGAEGIREWTAEILRNFERFELRLDEVHDLGERVLALGAIDLHATTSGVEMVQPMGWVFEVRDGKLARMLFYSSHAEAREAGGLGK